MVEATKKHLLDMKEVLTHNSDSKSKDEGVVVTPAHVNFEQHLQQQNQEDFEDGSSSSTDTESKKTNKDDNRVDQIVSKQNQEVNYSRALVAFAILAVGAGVSTLMYLMLSRNEKSDAANAFILFSRTIEDNFRYEVGNIFRANRALGKELTMSAKTHSPDYETNPVTTAFPYFVPPAFESYAHQARIQAGFEVIIFAPMANDVEKWVNFSQSTQSWLEESKRLFDELEPGMNRSMEDPRPPLDPYVYEYVDPATRTLQPMTQNQLFVVSLQTSPPPIQSDRYYQNVNMFSDPLYKAVSLAAVRLEDAVFSVFSEHFAEEVDIIVGRDYHTYLHEVDDGLRNSSTAMTSADFGINEEEQALLRKKPHCLASQPVYKALNGNDVVGYLYSIIAWDHYLNDLLPKGVDGIFVVVRNSCGQSFTFELQGTVATFLGEGDSHDPAYNDLVRIVDFSDNYINPLLTSQVKGHCQIFLDVYASNEFESYYNSHLPTIFAIIVAFLFLLMAGAFFVYDRKVQARNAVIFGVAKKTTAIVENLFPSSAYRDQLFQAQQEEEKKKLISTKKATLKGFLAENNEDADLDDDSDMFKTDPIAELYPETTVMFGDIAGFTAWSSVREPGQVFRLLESVYHSFDEIARRRRVFKVETIGDCYVAVCGLPTPRRDHAVVMARFARDCMYKMWEVTKRLEKTLGPDTGDLTMRIGLHSGPVTAGVLRGERSRFQLFGDTMNTASRMESNGLKSRIHLSKDTADLLILSGKSSWVSPREEVVHAKGKGQLHTFWLDLGDRSDTHSRDASSVADTSCADDDIPMDDHFFNNSIAQSTLQEKEAALPEKIVRLVEWNVDVFTRLLKQIVAQRKIVSNVSGSTANEDLLNQHHGQTVLDEVKEIITLPRFKAGSQSSDIDFDNVVLDPLVLEQLKDYIVSISFLYRNNPFHNFEHASHVTMSVVKLMNRIIAPSEIDLPDAPTADASKLHDHTYGITSDPLTQFACVFSALIHDLDHPGVPNAVLVEEKTKLALLYRNQSVAEQNSVDLAWSLLLDDGYKKLRETIYSNNAEMRRFRQLVVNSVMATDIIDKELKILRNARWEKAFSTDYHEESKEDAINRKATIVIEHLIQASDVAHTMQHWHIYRKWNQRFFRECYRAYVEGRAETDPCPGWYKGEIGFFDFYIIPLAKKLKNCGVFGVSSDEYLNYAMKNRKEWEDKGKEIVSEMIEHAHIEFGVRKAQDFEQTRVEC